MQTEFVLEWVPFINGERVTVDQVIDECTARLERLAALLDRIEARMDRREAILAETEGDQ